MPIERDGKLRKTAPVHAIALQRSGVRFPSAPPATSPRVSSPTLPKTARYSDKSGNAVPGRMRGRDVPLQWQGEFRKCEVWEGSRLVVRLTNQALAERSA